MRIKATCAHCGRDFYFVQVAGARPADADRCPHCGRHLGVPRLAPVAAAAESALAALVRALTELAGHQPAFRVDPDSVLEPVREALALWGAPTSRVA
jgi:NAD-dependent SIR2 family protein deacetylase